MIRRARLRRKSRRNPHRKGCEIVFRLQRERTRLKNMGASHSCTFDVGNTVATTAPPPLPRHVDRQDDCDCSQRKSAKSLEQ